MRITFKFNLVSADSLLHLKVTIVFAHCLYKMKKEMKKKSKVMNKITPVFLSEEQKRKCYVSF